MPSALDLRISNTTAALTAPGGQLPVTSFEAFGQQLPMIAVAPPTLPLYFAYFCMQHGASEFLVSGDERLTFGQVYAAADRVAKALVADHGVKKGDRVGIAMRNAPSWVVLYMGALMAGGVATLLNGWWQGAELAAGIDDVGCSLVLADPQRAQRLADHGYAGSAKVVTLDIGKPLDAALAPLFAGSGQGDLPELSGDDIATILFTSGSTGQSKGAFHTHRSVVQGAFSYIVQAMTVLQVAIEDGLVSADQDERPKPCMLLSVPLFHVTGEVPMMLVSFAIGRKIIMMPKWDAVEAMRLIEKEKITSFTGVPLMSFELLTHPDRKKYDLSTLQGLAGGGAPRPVEHVKRLAEEFPTAPPAIGYGLTETNGVGAGNFSTNYIDKPNSTGVATKPLVEIAILDDAGKPMPQGERGEVCIRSVANFSGYWNRPDATAACITSDGFFRTGDIGYLDPDDYLYIVDRKKDIIIRGGENISCQEVEAALYEHKAVAEACVFGLPDERLGEVPGAVVHLHAGQSASEDELRAHVRNTLAAFNTPERIWIEANALPRLGTEKIDKVGLRTRFQGEWAKRVPA
jgi:long-chain acyl-CoA synthetase